MPILRQNQMLKHRRNGDNLIGGMEVFPCQVEEMAILRMLIVYLTGQAGQIIGLIVAIDFFALIKRECSKYNQDIVSMIRAKHKVGISLIIVVAHNSCLDFYVI